MLRERTQALQEIHLLAEGPLEASELSLFHVGRCLKCVQVLDAFLHLREEKNRIRFAGQPKASDTLVK